MCDCSDDNLRKLLCFVDILRVLGESKAKVHIPLCPSLRRDQFAFSYDEPVRGTVIVSDVLFCVGTKRLVFSMMRI